MCVGIVFIGVFSIFTDGSLLKFYSLCVNVLILRISWIKFNYSFTIGYTDVIVMCYSIVCPYQYTIKML